MNLNGNMGIAVEYGRIRREQSNLEWMESEGNGRIAGEFGGDEENSMKAERWRDRQISKQPGKEGGLSRRFGGNGVTARIY